jgi:hypothetical protein
MKAKKLGLIMTLSLMLGVEMMVKTAVKAEEIQAHKIAQLLSGEREEVEQRNGYLGFGGNIPANASTSALGNGGLVILGRVGLMKHLSVEATGIVNNKIGGSVALTGNLPIVNKETNKLVARPFIGGGILIHEKIDPLATGGVTVPLTNELTGIIKVDVGFLKKETEVGVMLGIGYNFDLF